MSIDIQDKKLTKVFNKIKIKKKIYYWNEYFFKKKFTV